MGSTFFLPLKYLTLLSIQKFIDRFRYNAKRAKMAQSRIKKLEKMDVVPEVCVWLHHRQL